MNLIFILKTEKLFKAKKLVDCLHYSSFWNAKSRLLDCKG